MATTRKRFTPPKPQDRPESRVITETATPNERILHVNGEPIPTHLQHAIPYFNTDEGIAERNAKRPASSGVKMVRDASDKQRARAADEFENYNPLRDLVAGHEQPGFALRVLSPRVVQKRGKRGWEPVIDAKTGEPVKHEDLFLGRMPIEKQERRNAHYREIGNEALRNAEEQYQEEQRKLVRDSQARGIAPLHSGEVLTDWQNEGQTAVTGFAGSRGEDLDLAA